MRRILYLILFIGLISIGASVRGGGGGSGTGGGGTECASSGCNLNSATTLNSKNICLADGTNCAAISGSGTVSVGTTNRVSKYNGAVAVVDASSVLFDNGTNVGIGSSVPQTKLDVSGTTTATAFSGPLTGNVTGNVTGNLTGAVTGNSSTATALAANGSNCSAGNYPLGVDASGAVESCTAVPATSGGWTDGGTNITLTAAGDNVGVGTITLSTGKLTVAGNGSTTGITQQWQTNTGTANNVILDNGNVGIGTPTPANSLNIFRSGTAGGAAAITLNNYSSTAAGDNPQMLFVRARGTIASPSDVSNGDALGTFGAQAFSSSLFTTASIVWTVDGTFTTGQRPPSAVAIKTNAANTSPAERIRIDHSGNIGIGTSAPVNLLDVRGAAALGTYAGLSTAPSNGLAVSGNVGIGSSSAPAKLTIQGAGTTTGQSFKIVDSANTFRTTILDNGNIGIGSSLPEGNLIIRSSTNDAGWTAQAAANQACNTTCTSTCLIGFDQGVLGVSLGTLVNCSDATADECICAGSN